MWFCSDRCRERFEADPLRYPPGEAGHESMGPVTPDGPLPVAVGTRVRASATQLTAAAPDVDAVDPVCGMPVDPGHAGAHRVRDGVDHWFCCPGCAERFDAETDVDGLTVRLPQPFFSSCENGTSLSLPGSFGSPRTRSPMMLRWIWSVPP